MKLKSILISIVFVVLGIPLLITSFGMVNFQQVNTNIIAEPPRPLPITHGIVLLDVAFDIEDYYITLPFTTLPDGEENLSIFFENLTDSQVTVTVERLTPSYYWTRVNSFTATEMVSSTLVNYRNFVETPDNSSTDFRISIENPNQMPLAGILTVRQEENIYDT